MLRCEVHVAEEVKAHRPWRWAAGTDHLVPKSQQLLAEQQAGHSHTTGQGS